MLCMKQVTDYFMCNSLYNSSGSKVAYNELTMLLNSFLRMVSMFNTARKIKRNHPRKYGSLQVQFIFGSYFPTS